MWLRCLLLVSIAIGGAAVAQTTTKLYKSTGPDGKTVYSDQPPDDARAVKALTFRSEPASPLSPQTLAYIEELKKSAEARAAAPPPRETALFTAKWCGYCRQAKAYLASRQVVYREFDIETKDGVAAFARAGGKTGVPFLVIDGKSLSGFSESSYNAVLGPRQ